MMTAGACIVVVETYRHGPGVVRNTNKTLSPCVIAGDILVHYSGLFGSMYFCDKLYSEGGAKRAAIYRSQTGCTTHVCQKDTDSEVWTIIHTYKEGRKVK